MSIDGSLDDEVGDGLHLINICEIASGMSVGRYTKKPVFPGHKLDNINVALRFIERTWNTKVHCTPNVIFEGNRQAVLGLFFILHRAVTTASQQAPPPEPEPVKVPTPREPSPAPIQESSSSSSEEAPPPQIHEPPLEKSSSSSSSEDIPEPVKEPVVHKVPKILHSIEESPQSTDSPTTNASSPPTPVQEVQENQPPIPEKPKVEGTDGTVTPPVGPPRSKKALPVPPPKKLPPVGEVSPKLSPRSSMAGSPRDSPRSSPKRSPRVSRRDSHSKGSEDSESKDLSTEADRPKKPKAAKTTKDGVPIEAEKKHKTRRATKTDGETPKDGSVKIKLPKKGADPAPTRAQSMTEELTTKTKKPHTKHTRSSGEITEKPTQTMTVGRRAGRESKPISTEKSSKEKRRSRVIDPETSQQAAASAAATAAVTAPAADGGDPGKVVAKKSNSKRASQEFKRFSQEFKTALPSQGGQKKTSKFLPKFGVATESTAETDSSKPEENSAESETSDKPLDPILLARIDETAQIFTKTPNPLNRLQAVIRGRLSRKYPPKNIKDYNRRYLIAKELLSTEVFYVSCLLYLLEGYQKALTNFKDEDGKLIVEAPVTRSIFGSTQIIYNINKKLCDALQARMNNWFIEGCQIGNIFDDKMVGFLKVYITYVNTYDQAMANFRQCSKDERVRAEFDRVRTDTACPKSLDLASLLIMPIQRLPRYVMLLQDLLAHTPRTHIDYPALSKATDAVVLVAADVNSRKRASDNVAAVALIRQRLQFPNLDASTGLEKFFPNSSSRGYICQGYLGTFDPNSEKGATGAPEPIKIDECELRTKSLKSESQYLFLFSDSLICTTPASTEPAPQIGRGGLLKGLQDLIWANNEELKDWSIEELRDQQNVEFKFLNRFDLEAIEVVDPPPRDPTKPDPDSHIFGLAYKGSKTLAVTFACRDEKSKKQWMYELDSAIWGLLYNKRTRIQQKLTDSLLKEIKPRVSHTIATSVNFTGTPDVWETHYAVLKGTNLILYDRERDFLEGVNPKTIEGSILQADILLWPPPGGASFLDFEKAELTEKEMTYLKDQAQALTFQNLKLGPQQQNKFYCEVRFKPKPGEHPVSWYFCFQQQARRMAFVNKLRQAFIKVIEYTEAKEKEQQGPKSPKLLPAGLSTNKKKP